MTTIALQIAAAGLSWAVMPDPLSFDEENAVAGQTVRWPRVQHPERGPLPRELEERVLAYGIVGSLLEDIGAEAVLLAVEPDADRTRVGVVEVALDHAGVRVDLMQPHAQGAAGIIRQAVDELLRETARPPGM